MSHPLRPPAAPHRARRGLAVGLLTSLLLSGCGLAPGALAPPAQQTPASPTALPPGSLGERYDGQVTPPASGEAPDTPLAVTVPPTPPDYAAPAHPAPTAAAGLSAPPSISQGQAVAPAPDSLVGSTVGELVIDYGGGQQGRCTGTVVNSLSGGTVLTAAHCLHNPQAGLDAQSVRFTPGPTPEHPLGRFGQWQARRWALPPDFAATAQESHGVTTGAGWRHDFAFVQFAPDALGYALQERTGGQGLSFTAEFRGAQVFGYPQTGRFQPGQLYTCSSPHLGYGDEYWPHMTMPCDLTQGISGAAWLTGVDAATGAGYAGAVMSTVGAERSTAAPLGEQAYQLYRAMNEPAGR